MADRLAARLCEAGEGMAANAIDTSFSTHVLGSSRTVWQLAPRCPPSIFLCISRALQGPLHWGQVSRVAGGGRAREGKAWQDVLAT